MSDFAPHNIGAVGPGHHVNRIDARALRSRPEEFANGIARPADRVDLSSDARLLDRLFNGETVREDLVAQVRAEIEAGTYLTPEKLDRAVEDLLSDL